MKMHQITSIIHKHIPASQIHLIDCRLTGYADQIEYLKIILKPNHNTGILAISPILNDLDDLTIADEYGDMTQAKIEYSTYEELPNDEIGTSLTFTIDIDS